MLKRKSILTLKGMEVAKTVPTVNLIFTSNVKVVKI